MKNNLRTEIKLNEKIVKKYYERIFQGIHELGIDYDIYKDIFDLIWECLPEEYNMEYIIKYIDYAFLTEIEMMFVDMLEQNKGGELTYNPRNWWVTLFLSDCVYEMRKEPDFYLPLNNKGEEDSAHWSFLLDSSELIEKSTIRSKERARKWEQKQ